jgi:hypothetical protein
MASPRACLWSKCAADVPLLLGYERSCGLFAGMPSGIEILLKYSVTVTWLNFRVTL